MDRTADYNRGSSAAYATPSLPGSTTKQFAAYNVDAMEAECPQQLTDPPALPVSIPLHSIKLRSCKTTPVEPAQAIPGSYSLDHLCLYLTEEQKRMMMESAQSPYWQSRVDTIITEGFESRLFDDPDTCHTLYCGLVTGKIDPGPFMEFYLYLTLRLTFLSDSLQTNPLIGTYVPDMAASVKAVRKWNGKFKYEIRLRPEMQALMKNPRHMAYLQPIKSTHPHYLASWLSIFSSNEMGVNLESDWSSLWTGEKLVIDAWQDLVKNAAAKARGVQGLVPLVTFGGGGWEDLKALRQNGCHPVALWHPMIPESIVNPDGYWIGALASLHDIFHICRANALTPKERATLLMLDSITLGPSTTLAETLLTKEVTELGSEDQLFMNGCEQMFQELANGLASRSSSVHLKNEFPDLKTIKRHARLARPLIDQELLFESLLKDHQFQPYSVNLYVSPADELFAVSRLIYLALINKDNLESRLIARTLKFPLRTYPEVRARLESLKGPEQLDKMCYLLDNREDSLKWMIDWWCQFLHII